MKALLISITLLVAFIISLNLSSQKVNKRKEMPKNGFVPDAGTAKKIAEAIWVPIYGQEMIDGEKPFQAELFHDTAWHVNGTLPKGYSGGTAYIVIRKNDCKVLEVWHDK